jgi:hypothetical protein
VTRTTKPKSRTRDKAIAKLTTASKKTAKATKILDRAAERAAFGIKPFQKPEDKTPAELVVELDAILPGFAAASAQTVAEHLAFGDPADTLMVAAAGIAGAGIIDPEIVDEVLEATALSQVVDDKPTETPAEAPEKAATATEPETKPSAPETVNAAKTADESPYILGEEVKAGQYVTGARTRKDGTYFGVVQKPELAGKRRIVTGCAHHHKESGDALMCAASLAQAL